MTRNKNLMSTVATTLGMMAMLAFGGATASMAGSNDVSPFKFFPEQPRAASQAQSTKRNAPPKAHNAYAQDRDRVGGAGTHQEFPRGAQGGW